MSQTFLDTINRCHARADALAGALQKQCELIQAVESFRCNDGFTRPEAHRWLEVVRSAEENEQALAPQSVVIPLGPGHPNDIQNTELPSTSSEPIAWRRFCETAHAIACSGIQSAEDQQDLDGIGARLKATEQAGVVDSTTSTVTLDKDGHSPYIVTNDQLSKPTAPPAPVSEALWLARELASLVLYPWKDKGLNKLLEKAREVEAAIEATNDPAS